MLHIFLAFRVFNSQSIRVRALFAAFAFSVCLTIAQTAMAQLNLTVTRNDDRDAVCVSGDCSLREAVKAANASTTDDTINFASGLTTITLNNEIVIDNAGALAINGTGANVLMIEGGAGMNRIFYTNQATVNITGMTLTGGNGTGVTSNNNGGAIFANGGSLTLDRVHLTGNSASNIGGGAIFDGGTNCIINSTFSDNNAGLCGGFFNFHGMLTVVNSTISGNTAEYTIDGYGGGFCNYGVAMLRNVTVTENFASGEFGGAGIANFGMLNFGNTIVAGNSDFLFDSDISNVVRGIITSAGGNLVGNSPGDSTNTDPAIAYQPTDILDVNPMLGTLQNNGGSTPTHALTAGSPAIDKGLNSLAVDPFNNLMLQTDQRGLARTFGSAVDIGAFEFGSAKSRKRIRFF